MPGLFITFIIFAVIAALAFIIRKCLPKGESGSDEAFARGVAAWAGGIVAFIALVLLIISSVAFVGTKDIGVKTAFGKPVGSLSNGIHFKAPWEKVTTIDDAVQIDSYTNDNKNGDGPCITVRITRNATACVDTSIKWQIKQSAGDDLFRNYRNFGKIRDSLVVRNLQQAVNKQFADYDPLGIDAQGNTTAATLTELSNKVQQQMQSEIGNQIDVVSVIIPVMHFDNDTQGRINALQSQVAQTRIAQQAKLTADQQAAANQALAASVNNSPGVLESKCLDLLQEALNKGQQIQPLAFQCFPGTSNNGNVLVQQPAAK